MRPAQFCVGDTSVTQEYMNLNLSNVIVEIQNVVVHCVTSMWNNFFRFWRIVTDHVRSMMEGIDFTRVCDSGNRGGGGNPPPSSSS